MVFHVPEIKDLPPDYLENILEIIHLISIGMQSKEIKQYS